MSRCAEPGGIMVWPWWVAVAGLVLALLCVPARADDVRPVPFAVFTDQIAAGRKAAAGCAQNPALCSEPQLPSREVVWDAPGGAFRANWDWLGDALRSAKGTQGGDRVKAMDRVRVHLDRLAAEAGAGDPESPGELARAHGVANEVLARPEFRANEQPDWFERQMARLQDWVLELFAGIGGLGRRAPWLAPLIEWGCFALAAAGLLWFVRQSLARQALRISLADSAGLPREGRPGVTNWAQRAEQRAAAGDWRDAVHCVYWAGIAMLEGRRAWKPNPTRTPREYLRLLPPRSEAAEAMRALTRSFEGVWYGRAEADEEAYRRALGSLRALEALRPERAAAEPRVPFAAEGRA